MRASPDGSASLSPLSSGRRQSARSTRIVDPERRVGVFALRLKPMAIPRIPLPGGSWGSLDGPGAPGTALGRSWVPGPGPWPRARALGPGPGPRAPGLGPGPWPGPPGPGPGPGAWPGPRGLAWAPGPGPNTLQLNGRIWAHFGPDVLYI